MSDEIKDREEVAEEATSETPVEEVEQREDDYEGLKRILESKLDELSAKLDEIAAKIESRIESDEAALVDSGAIIIGEGETVDAIEDEIEEEAGDEIVDAIMAGDVSLEELLEKEED